MISTARPLPSVRLFALASFLAAGFATGCATGSGGGSGGGTPAPSGTASGTASGAGAAAAATEADGRELPLKFAGGETGPDITVHDLMTRLYIVADDSMLGREAGAPGGVKITDYLAREAQRIGLEPAGENGTFFQTIPLMDHGIDSASVSLTVDGAAGALTLGRDYQPLAFLGGAFPFGGSLSGTGLQTIYGGRFGDSSLKPEQAKGKLVVFDAVLGPDGQPIFQFWSRRVDLRDYREAAGIAVVGLEQAPPSIGEIMGTPRTWFAQQGARFPSGATAMLLTRAAAERILGAPIAGLRTGAAGRRVNASVTFGDRPTRYPARNVVAILRGSDQQVRGQYVAIGAHSDHVGLEENEPADHDSLRAFLTVARPRGADDDLRRPTSSEATRIRGILDSLRRVHTPRTDSVYNGADDDGSGTVTVLEVAQALVRQPPRRSVLFVWHIAEEAGLWGADYFTRNPTVPRDSIVAQVNLDMIGRGGTDDLPNAGPGYLQVIGPRRLSTEYAQLIERVNTTGQHGMRFDYEYDANGHPDQFYCRSDHYMYARYGIPVAFFSAGGHRDYHQLTDEPQYIRYNQLRNVALYVLDLTRTVANLDHRLAVDKPKPDPEGSCVQ